MREISGATVFDDLPDSIITQEIFARLPSIDVLRCGAVSRSWRRATSTREFLHEHHRRQPSLPLVRHEVSHRNDDVEAFDIRGAPGKRRHVLGCYNGLYFGIDASCDGLLLLSLPNSRFRIVNPVTRQWLALPCLTGAVWPRIKGTYPHPHRSGEYRIVFWRGNHEVRNAGYYILTVGSSKNQKPKYIGQPVASASTATTEDLLAGIHSYVWRSPPILLNGCLHWNPYHHLKDRLLAFDTLEESFRSMRTPTAARGTRYLFEMEGTLGMRCLDDIAKIMQVWVLQDYESVTWSLRCQIDEFPNMASNLDTMLSCHEKYSVLVYYITMWSHTCIKFTMATVASYWRNFSGKQIIQELRSIGLKKALSGILLSQDEVAAMRVNHDFFEGFKALLWCIHDKS